MGESTLSPYSLMAMIHTAPVAYYEGRKGVVLKKYGTSSQNSELKGPTEGKEEHLTVCHTNRPTH